jgi:hypothetical protein
MKILAELEESNNPMAAPFLLLVRERFPNENLAPVPVLDAHPIALVALFTREFLKDKLTLSIYRHIIKHRKSNLPGCIKSAGNHHPVVINCVSGVDRPM